jgi:hypothetical protein
LRNIQAVGGTRPTSRKTRTTVADFRLLSWLRYEGNQRHGEVAAIELIGSAHQSRTERDPDTRQPNLDRRAVQGSDNLACSQSGDENKSVLDALEQKIATRCGNRSPLDEEHGQSQKEGIGRLPVCCRMNLIGVRTVPREDALLEQVHSTVQILRLIPAGRTLGERVSTLPEEKAQENGPGRPSQPLELVGACHNHPAEDYTGSALSWLTLEKVAAIPGSGTRNPRHHSLVGSTDDA